MTRTTFVASALAITMAVSFVSLDAAQAKMSSKHMTHGRKKMKKVEKKERMDPSDKMDAGDKKM